jgi:hypothetical protein
MRTEKIPSYRLHKARNCAVVRINGRDHYLGEYNSPESRELYRRLIAEYLFAKELPAPPRPDESPLTLVELIQRYFGESHFDWVLSHAQKYFGWTGVAVRALIGQVGIVEQPKR